RGNAQAELIETQLLEADVLGAIDSSGKDRELMADVLKSGETLIEQFPEVSRYHLLLARAYRTRGAMLQRQGDNQTAEQDYRRAVKLARQALACRDASPGDVTPMAQSHATLARFLASTDRPREAGHVLEDSIVLLENGPKGPATHDALDEQHDLLAELLGP